MNGKRTVITWRQEKAKPLLDLKNAAEGEIHKEERGLVAWLVAVSRLKVV
jgi:hypothetical protein